MSKKNSCNTHIESADKYGRQQEHSFHFPGIYYLLLHVYRNGFPLKCSHVKITQSINFMVNFQKCPENNVNKKYLPGMEKGATNH